MLDLDLSSPCGPLRANRNLSMPQSHESGHEKRNSRANDIREPVGGQGRFA